MAVPIKDELLYRGCNPNPEIITPSKEIIKIGSLLDSLNLKESILPKESLKKVLKTSREFLNTYYDLHFVPCNIEYKRLFWSLELSGNINPFKLPIRRVKDVDDFYGSLRESILATAENSTITFRGIELPKNITKLSSLSYTHEITHTQLNHMPGLIQEYYNTEFLSIFNELLHAFYTKDSESLLREHDAKRLNELKIIINELDKYQDTEDDEIRNVLLEGSSYLESTLKAYNLFVRYYYSRESERKYIIQQLQRVIDGEITLEEILNILDVSLENSQDIKTIKKYLKR